MTKFTIYYLEKAVVDLSQKGQVAIYDAQNGGHGVSIPIERFLKLSEAVNKELVKTEIQKGLGDVIPSGDIKKIKEGLK